MTTRTKAPSGGAAHALTDHKRAAQAAAAIRQRPGFAAGAPAPGGSAGGLRAVDDEPAAPSVFARAPALSAVSPAEPVLAVPRLDRQGRGAITAVCGALGWGADTPLAAYIDADARRVWVQRTASPAADSDCDRCQQPQSPPALPGQPARAAAAVHVDTKAQLVLRDGLCAAVGLSPPAQVVVLAVPELHAAVVGAPSAVAAGLLGEEAGSPAAPVASAGQPASPHVAGQEQEQLA